MNSKKRVSQSKLLPLSVMLSTLFICTPNLNAAEQQARLVTIEQAKTEEVSPVVWLSGNVTSRLNVRLATELSGRLLWILDVGELVTKGQPIARLDTQELEFQLAEKQSQLRQQQANTIYLEKQQKRLKSLLNNNSTARIEFDRTQRDLSIALEALKSLKIQIKRTELAIEKATLRAPFEGKVNQRMAQAGEYISVGTTLIQLVDPQSLDIAIAAPLSVAPYLKRGDKMLVKWNENLIALPVRTWSPAGKQASRSFDVRLDATDLNLMSGNSVLVSLPKEQASLSTMVPRDALILRKKETSVVMIDHENRAHKINVVVGTGFGDWVSVNGKVGAGDSVVVRGGESLQDGQKVRYEITAEKIDSTVVANL